MVNLKNKNKKNIINDCSVMVFFSSDLNYFKLSFLATNKTIEEKYTF